MAKPYRRAPRSPRPSTPIDYSDPAFWQRLADRLNEEDRLIAANVLAPGVFQAIHGGHDCDPVPPPPGWEGFDQWRPL